MCDIFPIGRSRIVTKLKDEFIYHEMVDGFDRYTTEYIELIDRPTPFRSSPFLNHADNMSMRALRQDIRDGVLGCGTLSWSKGALGLHIAIQGFKNSD